MKGHIPSAELHRLAYNAKLFANKDSASQGRTLWIYGANGLRVASSDDYVVLTDQSDVVDSYSGVPQYWTMEPEALKALEKDVKGDSGTYDLGLLDLCKTPIPELYDMEAMAFDVEHWDEIPVPVYAIRADRLQKFSLIKPQAGPIDIKAFSAEGQVVVGWKAGETCRGLIAPLDREMVREAGMGYGLW